MDAIHKLIDTMARLRDPERGCPWDQRQSFATIVPYTIEEAYEVADAIERRDFDHLKDELGDLLLQVVFYAQMANEDGLFDFEEVAETINGKLRRRHPHVFGDTRYETDAERAAAWEAEKARERQAKNPTHTDHSVLDGVALALPALGRALKLQRRAAKVGFDWDDVAAVLNKIGEELEECRHVLDRDLGTGPLAEEIGDLLFSVVNLARHVEVDAEEALRRSNRKFETRFRRIERWIAEGGKDWDQCTLAELDVLWERAKSLERSSNNESPP
jgi:MazG family protein